jgi:predicted kinase
MLGKLLMLTGLQGSGKTTLAQNKVKSNPEWARVSRDDLREMIFAGKWDVHKEATIIKCEQAIAKCLLTDGYSTIIDDTNLLSHQQKLWKDFCKQNKTEMETIAVITPVEECIQRDSKRTTPVGEKSIRSLARKAGIKK